MQPKSFLKNGVVKVWNKSYSIVKARYVPDNYFTVIQDFNEITVITDTESVDPDWVLLEEKPYKILTFDMTLPFDLIGFLSIVSTALAKEKITIFALSSFSTDHILVKEADLPKTIQTLQNLQCKIINL